MKRPASHLGALALVVSVAIGWCAVCAGQSAPTDGENVRPAANASSRPEAKRDGSNGGTIPYRRVFVPDDGKAEVLSRDCRDCRPVKADEFEALLRAAAAMSRAAPGANGARLRSAEYSAQFRDGQTLTGQAELEIVASPAGNGSLAL
ncbi:MAG: hypothetical protein KDA71_26570, partial [Planctomycetales bacterium]|nr:hypothetical protein [Planctomycetales bacterium]